MKKLTTDTVRSCFEIQFPSPSVYVFISPPFVSNSLVGGEERYFIKVSDTDLCPPRVE
jgi:hypothetical protein